MHTTTHKIFAIVNTKLYYSYGSYHKYLFMQFVNTEHIKYIKSMKYLIDAMS